MSYRDFEQGISGSRLQKWKEREAREQLRDEMKARWQESERILYILRSTGSVPDTAEGVEAWFQKVKKHSVPSIAPEHAHQWTPCTWFSSKFPEVAERFGRAFFEGTVSGPQGSAVIRSGLMNEDFFAAILGGEKRLGHRMLYLPGEGFLYHDPKVNAFAQTSDQKVEILLSNYLIKCAEHMGRGVDTMLLVGEHRRPAVLRRIVNRAKTVLEADPRFFEGENGGVRFQSGQICKPQKVSSPEHFIHHALAPEEGACVVVGEAYQEFLRYCQMERLMLVEFREFKQMARELIMEKYQLGLRHDIRTREGRQTHGWKHLRLLPDPLEQKNEAA